MKNRFAFALLIAAVPMTAGATSRQYQHYENNMAYYSYVTEFFEEKTRQCRADRSSGNSVGPEQFPKGRKDINLEAYKDPNWKALDEIQMSKLSRSGNDVMYNSRREYRACLKGKI